MVAARAFGPPRLCVEGSSLLVSGGAKPQQGVLYKALAVAARAFAPPVLLGRVVTFGLKGRETVAGAYSKRALVVAARSFGRLRFAWNGRHFWSQGARSRGRGVL